MSSFGDPYSLAIGGGLSLGEGLLKHSLGKRANRKFAARRDAASNAIRDSGRAARSRIRRETSQIQARSRNDLARRGLDSTSVYDGVVNGALDQQYRAESEIDANVGNQLAQLIANSPDPYDGNAIYAGLTGVAKAAGTYMGGPGQASGGDGLGGGGRQSGDADNQSLAAMSGVLEPMQQTPGGGPAFLPGGGTQVSPDQFSANSGQFPGQAGFSPYGALLDSPDELEMDGAPKPRKRKSAVQSAYASAY